jgi:hypothetical protein
LPHKAKKLIIFTDLITSKARKHELGMGIIILIIPGIRERERERKRRERQRERYCHKYFHM